MGDSDIILHLILAKRPKSDQTDIILRKLAKINEYLAYDSVYIHISITQNKYFMIKLKKFVPFREV